MNMQTVERERGILFYATVPPPEGLLVKRSYSWWKLNAMHSAMRFARSDWILWLDADAYLTRPPTQLLSNLPENKLPHKFASCNTGTVYLAHEMPIPVLPHPTSNFNLGVILLNTTNAISATRMLRFLWDAKDCSSNFLLNRNWEQSCLDDKLRTGKYSSLQMCALNFTFMNTPHGTFVRHIWQHNRRRLQHSIDSSFSGMNTTLLINTFYARVHPFSLRLLET